MPGKNPPRKTTIRGQRHLLAYITPDEAALLKARGGSGELHKGIPSYPPDSQSGAGANVGPDNGGNSGGEGGGSRSGPRGGRGGGRASAGMSTARGPEGQFGGEASRSRQVAQMQLTQQINKAKQLQKAQSKKPLIEQVITSIIPGFNVNSVQNYAARFMANKIKGILSDDPDATVVRDSKTGRITGIRDQYGRLTGRDPDQERSMADVGGEAGVEERRKKALLAQQKSPDAETPTLGKRVIRSDLAKETEAERLAGRRLGRRSLLSRTSSLGA